MLVDVSGQTARELARRELEDGRYAKAEPSLATRLVKRLIDAVVNLFDSAAAATPGGSAGVVLVLVLLVALAMVIAVRLRVVRGSGGARAVFSSGAARTPAEHRAQAEAFAADGAYDEAVRERLRAVVRELELRGVLDPRPGRTAVEVAAEAGRLVPAHATPLQRAAATFDEVWYGGRSADAAAYGVLVDVDKTVTSTRLVLA